MICFLHAGRRTKYLFVYASLWKLLGMKMDWIQLDNAYTNADS
jgi:hypothetical protein